jgi:hypothetical protein
VHVRDIDRYKRTFAEIILPDGPSSRSLYAPASPGRIGNSRSASASWRTLRKKGEQRNEVYEADPNPIATLYHQAKQALPLQMSEVESASSEADSAIGIAQYTGRMKLGLSQLVSHGVSRLRFRRSLQAAVDRQRPAPARLW